MKPKRIVLFTSTGPVGISIAQKALNRGHIITAIIEGNVKEFNLSHPNLTVLTGDVNRTEEISQYVKNNDIIIYDQELWQNMEGEYFKTTRSVIMICKNVGITHLIISGHISSINSDLTNEERNAWRPIQEEQLDTFKLLEKQSDLSWAYFYTWKADLMITGTPILGDDFVIVTPNKESRLPITEYAESIIDEMEKNENVQLKREEISIML